MVNRIIAENAITTGVATKDYWDVPHSNQIEGFTTDFSVNAGTAVDFKINVNGGAGSDYQVEIFRLGYYGGAGAREVASWTNTNATVQPDALYDATRGMVDAGNWSVTDSWTIPPDAVSGVYLARVQRLDAAGNPIDGAVNQIPFVVRNDGVAADIVLQTSDTTWQAYNGWFGNNGQVGANFYGDASGTINHPDIPGAGGFAQDRAYALSYNRPFITRDGTSPASGGQDYLFGADYSAIYWLEQQGYDVSYISGVDTDRLGPNYLTNYKAFISVGHDEYWSGDQRDNVEAARDAGVNLLFWSGNEVYWKTRWETSISADGTPYRTLVCYKETWAHADPNAGPEDYYNLDPSNVWTGTWRDTRFHGNPLAGGGNPQDVDPISGLCATCNCGENKLTGTIFGPDGTGEFGGALDVPAQFAGLRVWRDTTVANGGQLDIAPGIIGYEWDTSPDDILRPQGLIKLSETTLPWGAIVVDQGNTTQPGTATHNLTLYRAESGALVFGAGTVFWSWALSDQHDSSPYGAQITNTDLQQFTVNMFADMGIQPGVADAVLQSRGLVRAIGSTDTVAATASIDDLPATITALSPVMITGTATDDDGNPLTADGQVAVVEVSLDGGLSWRVARTSDAWATWSYTWTPTQLGAYTILARAIDDSLNLATASTDSEALTVTTPDVFSMFGGVTPSGTLVNDGQTVEVGMRFTVDRAGEITQLKYWRSEGDSADTDVRDGHLWASDGTLLATVTFTAAPGASGWQIAALSAPVALAANATYVVSYRTADNYFSTTGFFDPSREVAYDGIDDNAFGGPFGVIRAPESGSGGGNGVYVYGTGAPRFPNLTFMGENYWVDVTFNPADTGNNQLPAFTSAPSFAGPENQTVVGMVTANDPDGNALTYGIVGGADAGRFWINSTTGLLSFLAAPDFETPTDADGNNVYELTVSVSDGVAAPVTQSILVNVSDVSESGTTYRLYGAGDLPAQIKTDDPTAYELGTKFQSSAAGWITDLRYFRGLADASDTDVRTLNLWSITGVQLAQATVTSTAGATGWQVGTLTTPFAIQANTTYVVSYGTTQNYAFTAGYFTNAHTGPNGVLTALASGSSGGNGVFAGGAPGTFPTGTFNASNYWVDVTFTQTLGSPPVFTSSTAFLADENQTAIATVTATDADNDTLAFAIVGGTDAARFAINASTGALRFLAAPDFEAPGDANGDNVYQVTLGVSDGSAAQVTQAVTVTVNDVVETPPNTPPVITSAPSFTAAESQTVAADVQATDADGDTLTYAIVAGADAGLFTIDAQTGVLSFLAAPDFEAPVDANGDNTYQLSVSVSDGTAPAVTQALSVTVTNVNETPVLTSAAAVSVAENQTAALTVTGTDPDGDALTYAIAGGADAGLFTIDAQTGVLAFLAAPNFEAPADANGDNTYQVTVSTSDGTAAPVTQALSITVTDVNETPANLPPAFTSPSSVSAAENQSLAATLTATDPDADTLTYAIAGGADAGLFTIDAQTGVLSFLAAPDFEAPVDANGDNTYQLSVSVSDGTAPAVTQALSVTVTNVNETPSIAPITAPATDEDAAPVQIDLLAGASDPEADPVSLSGPVTVTSSNATRTVVFSVTGGVLTLDPAQFGSMVAGQTEVITIAYQISDGTNPAVANTATITVSGRDESAPGQVITGTSRANTLNGGTGDDAISGLGGNDVLNGNAGNDTLDGGTGTDTVNGNDGNDIILIRGSEAQSDVMNGGLDTDTLRFAGTAAVVLTGTSQLTGIEIVEGAGLGLNGTNLDNVIDLSVFTTVTGLASLSGLGGNDTLTGSAVADTINGGAGNDVIVAGNGDDIVLIAGSDALLDTMDGGIGADTLRLIGKAAVALTGTSQLAGFETLDGAGLSLTGTNSNNVIDLSGFTSITALASLQGLAGNDTLTGSAFADTINGGAGTDLINAGDGDDIVLMVSSEAATDTVNGGTGNDTLRLSGTATVVLNATALISNVEILDGAGLTLAGSGNADVLDLSIFASVINLAELQGLNGNDTLTGSGGSDRINGGAGTDTITAGDGDDTIVISGNQATSDIIAGGLGVDRILVLAAGGNVVIGSTARITGVESFDGAGVAVIGTGAADTLDFSGIGNLVNVAAIQGLGGNDTIAGGSGNDTMIGGNGADSFVFAFGLTTGDDVISDFDAAGNDVIRLVGYAPGSNLAAATSFDGLGALIDLDAIGGDGSIRLSGVTNLSFTTEDFIFA